jgi:hypothetical protein
MRALALALMTAVAAATAAEIAPGTGARAHLHRYLAEADSKYSMRSEDDADRADALLRATRGKRLLYRRPDGETVEPAPDS